ncbi:MAG: response regulator [Kofleriaceae bacterium]|nr:response regulator [Kofleriaceae bacterium]
MEDARVLIVDDNRDVLASIRRTLKRCGFQLTCLDSPQEAIALLKTEQFDLLLSDIDMPVLNGHEVMSEAQKLQPTMIRVFVTGAGSMDAAVRAINEGEVHRFVRKPFEAQGLRNLLKEALERKAELDVASEASDRARRRRSLYRQLEVEHPGITGFSLDEKSYYVVDTSPMQQLAASLGLECLAPS